MKKSALFLLTVPLVLSTAASDARPRKSDETVQDMQRLQESNNKILADTVQAVNTIQIDLQAMKGALEENRHFFQQESEKNATILKDFDLRLTGMEERLSLFESQIQEALGKGGSGKAPAATGDESELYRKALGEVNAQNYKAAMPLFDQFLRKYPKSAMADNAQYWKGEALYGLKQFPEAILEFQKVVKKFPKSDKVPASILKQGYCFYEAKEYLDAKAFLQKVVTLYPKSDEAGKAREKIKQIDAASATARPR